MGIHTDTYRYIHTYTYTREYTHTRTRTHTYTYTHANKHIRTVKTSPNTHITQRSCSRTSRNTPKVVLYQQRKSCTNNTYLPVLMEEIDQSINHSHQVTFFL